MKLFVGKDPPTYKYNTDTNLRKRCCNPMSK